MGVNVWPYDQVAKVDSSVIDKLYFNSRDDELLVQFKSGSSRVYFDVEPETFEEFVKSNSVGRYYNTWIKGDYDSDDGSSLSVEFNPLTVGTAAVEVDGADAVDTHQDHVHQQFHTGGFVKLAPGENVNVRFLPEYAWGEQTTGQQPTLPGKQRYRVTYEVTLELQADSPEQALEAVETTYKQKVTKVEWLV